MHHTIKIDLAGVPAVAVATIEYTHHGRALSSVKIDEIPDAWADALARCALSLDDVLFVVGEYLSLTGRQTLGTACGRLTIDATVLDLDRWRDDLHGRSYSVKLVDCHSLVSFYDVGAHNGLVAMRYASDAHGVPVRSSMSVPVTA